MECAFHTPMTLAFSVMEATFGTDSELVCPHAMETMTFSWLKLPKTWQSGNSCFKCGWGWYPMQRTMSLCACHPRCKSNTYSLFKKTAHLKNLYQTLWKFLDFYQTIWRFLVCNRGLRTTSSWSETYRKSFGECMRRRPLLGSSDLCGCETFGSLQVVSTNILIQNVGQCHS